MCDKTIKIKLQQLVNGSFRVEAIDNAINVPVFSRPAIRIGEILDQKDADALATDRRYLTRVHAVRE